MKYKYFFLLFLSSMQISCSSISKNPEEKLVNKIDTGIANVYLIKSTKNILVDTSEQGKEQFIIDEMKKLGVKPEQLSLIILTHAHGDHAGGANYFQAKYKIPVLAGEKDLPIFSAGKNDELKPTDGFSNIIKLFSNKTYTPFKPDIRINSEYSLKDYGLSEGRVIPYPGHTPGSLVVILNKKEAIVGDMIRGGIFANTTPTQHFFHADLHQARKNIKSIMDSGVETLYTGHFGPLKVKDITPELYE